MIRKKLLTTLAILGVATMVFTGCSSKKDDTNNTSKVEQSENDSSSSSDDKSDVTDNNSDNVQTSNDTVVASSVAVVQILDALNVEMAGVPTSSYELPESVANATRIGNPMEPDMEIIASLEPTVVVSVDSLSEDLKSQFDTIGAESFFLDLSSYDGLKESIVSLGERFGVEEKAQSIVDDFEERESAIDELVKDKESPNVLIIFGAGSNFMVASEDTYVGDMVKRVGGTNIISDAPAAFSPIDMEYLASKNPDYILFMAHANPEESLEAFKSEFETNVAWQSFDAVKNGKVIALETGYFGMSANLQAIDAMEKLVGILYE